MLSPESGDTSCSALGPYLVLSDAALGGALAGPAAGVGAVLVVVAHGEFAPQARSLGVEEARDGGHLAFFKDRVLDPLDVAAG